MKAWGFQTLTYITFQIGSHVDMHRRISRYISYLGDAFPWRISIMVYLIKRREMSAGVGGGYQKGL
jgi:hypothetical protein